jgi:tRNA(adenine34) deaminase
MIEEKNTYLKLAIEKSKESSEKGFFPAGALVVKKGKILSAEISFSYPGYKHAELEAIGIAFDNLKKPLNNCVLYASMEPCLMCLSVSYWAGIRKIVFACNKKAVSSEYFESNEDNIKIINNFHEKIELVHIKELQNEALKVIGEWEKKQKK